MVHKMLKTVYEEKEKCFGCGLCAHICETNAITMKADSEGFLYPEIDDMKCIHCNNCRTNCIATMSMDHNDNEVYACSAREDEVLKESTSGGIAYILGRKIVEEGGVVYGASFGQNNEVKHIRVEDVDGLWKTQGTKYVQSNIGDVFKCIAQDIDDNRTILFTGTPCQVAAIKQHFGEYSRIVLLEIVCMGCPSPKVWSDYISEKEKEIGKIEKVKFRDKKIGWRGSNITLVTRNAEYTYRAAENEFLMGFGQCMYIRPSCHTCLFKGRKTVGDIKVGDFWGIENSKLKFNNKGTSVVIVETSRGKEVFEKIRPVLDVSKANYRLAVSSNPCIEISKAPSKYRSTFFEEYGASAEKSILELIRKNLISSSSDYDRYICQYPVIDGLLRLVVSDGGITQFFEKNEIHKIAVYGMSDLGKLFVDILLKEGIRPECIIDKNPSRYSSYKGIPVIGPFQIVDYDYDCIVVALVHLYNSVLETLMAQGVSLDSIISLGSVV